MCIPPFRLPPLLNIAAHEPLWTTLRHRTCAPQTYWWWELVYTGQRLLVVGFVQWIQHLSVRLFVGFNVSVVYLIILLVAKPVRLITLAHAKASVNLRYLLPSRFLDVTSAPTQHKRSDVGILAYVSQIVMVVIFMMFVMFRLFNSLDEEASDNLASKILGFSSIDTLVVTTISVTFAFITFFVGVTVYQAFSSADVELLRLTTSGQPPDLTLKDGMAFHLFLSHIWSSGQGAGCAQIDADFRRPNISQHPNPKCA